VDALIVACGAWLSAALLFYAASPSFLTHPYHHFAGPRFAIGVIVLPAIGVASISLVMGRPELACAVGIPAGGLLYVGAAVLERLMKKDRALTPQQREQRDTDRPPFAPTAALWVGSLLGLAVATFVFLLLIFH
jgi:hypothetical protein